MDLGDCTVRLLYLRKRVLERLRYMLVEGTRTEDGHLRLDETVKMVCSIPPLSGYLGLGRTSHRLPLQADCPSSKTSYSPVYSRCNTMRLQNQTDGLIPFSSACNSLMIAKVPNRSPESLYSKPSAAFESLHPYANRGKIRRSRHISANVANHPHYDTAPEMKVIWMHAMYLIQPTSG
jgi:hypothetical protein